MKMSPLDRVLLLAAALLAGYQVAVGIDGFASLPIAAYTIAFGVLLVTCLLLIVLGFEALDAQVTPVIATIIPLSLSLGLVWQHLPAWRTPYLIFAILGFLAIGLTRLRPRPGKLPTIVLALVHGLAGMTIFLLPIWLALQGREEPLFALVGLGGALIGLGGLLLSFLKAGKPLVPKATLLKALPVLLFLMTLCFVAGFAGAK